MKIINKNKKVNYLSYLNNYKMINKKKLSTIKNFFLKTKENSRICLHQNIDDTHQEMIILQKKHSYFPPKKNIKSDQTFFIIEGQLMVIIFDNKGNIKSKIILSKKNNLMLRVKKNTFHCDIPLSKFAIHYESKNCQFNKFTNKLAKFKFNFSQLKN